MTKNSGIYCCICSMQIEMRLKGRNKRGNESRVKRAGKKCTKHKILSKLMGEIKSCTGMIKID
jgi:hypothetical protein